MNFNGKIIGLTLGLFLGGGLIGMLIGLIIGHIYDTGYLRQWLNPLEQSFQQTQARNAQRVFFDTTFTTLGYLAKIDGRVSENEIEIATRVMDQMNLNSSMRNEAIQLFSKGKQSNFDLHAAINRLKQACWQQPNLCQTFLDIQTQMVNADRGIISLAKRKALQNIADLLSAQHSSFDPFRQRAYDEYQYQRQYQHQYQNTTNSSAHPLSDAYHTLGVTANANDTEIKKAYRRLMSKHHPDKLVAKGLSPAMIKTANEKTQKIKKAYETLKKYRNL